MKTLLLINLYFIPFLGCIGIIGYLLKFEKNRESIILITLFFISFIPILNFVLSFLIIGSYLLDKIRKI